MRITEKDLMLGDIIAFNISDKQKTVPYEVVAIGHGYVQVMPYFRNETTSIVEIQLGGKDDWTISDVPLSEKILNKNFHLYESESNNYKIAENQRYNGASVVYDGILEDKTLYITRIFIEDLRLNDESIMGVYSIRKLQRFLKSINIEWDVKI